VFASRDEAVADYLRELRLRRARDLSSRDTETETRIGDFAYRYGFDDPAHFTRSFRQRFGATPIALRVSGSLSES
jgi:AraC-like DNA-binding protein